MDSETSCSDKRRLHELGSNLPKSLKAAFHAFSAEPASKKQRSGFGVWGIGLLSQNFQWSTKHADILPQSAQIFPQKSSDLR